MVGPEKRSYRIWPWLVVALLWVVALLNYLDRQVIFSIFPLLQKELHANSIELGLTSTIFLFTYALFSPFAGYIADVFGRSRVIIGSLVVWSLACIGASQVHSVLGMLGSRAGMGVSEAFYIPAALALIVEIHGERSKSLATGIHQTGCYTGMILGGTLGGMAGQSFGWRPLFAVLGIIGVAYAVLLYAVVRTRKSRFSEQRAARLDIAPLLHNSGLRLFTGIFMAYSIATWIIYTWLPLYLYQRFHISLLAAGFQATFWIQAACFVGAFGGGFLADRPSLNSGRRRLLVQIFGLSLACPFLLVLSHSTSQVVVVIALITIGLGKGCFDANTTPVLVNLVDVRLCSTSYGALNCAGSIVGGLGALAGGWMRQQENFSLVFDLAGFGVALAVLGLVILTRHLTVVPPKENRVGSQPSIAES
jgi:MFS family permease